MRFTLNGVSPRNHFAFLREVDAVVDRDFERVFGALVEQSELEVDDPLDLFDEPFSQPVHWRTNVRFFDQSRRYGGNTGGSKRKEVK